MTVMTEMTQLLIGSLRAPACSARGGECRILSLLSLLSFQRGMMTGVVFDAGWGASMGGYVKTPPSPCRHIALSARTHGETGTHGQA